MADKYGWVATIGDCDSGEEEDILGLYHEEPSMETMRELAKQRSYAMGGFSVREVKAKEGETCFISDFFYLKCKRFKMQ